MILNYVDSWNESFAKNYEMVKDNLFENEYLQVACISKLSHCNFGAIYIFSQNNI